MYKKISLNVFDTFRLIFRLERLTGVEPAYAAWEAAVLPMNYSRKTKT